VNVNRKRLRWMGYLQFAAIGAAMMAVAATLKEVSSAIGIDTKLFGSIIFLCEYSGFVIASALGGFLADRFTKRNVLLAGLALLALTICTYGLSHWLVVSSLSILVFGVSGGLIEATASAFVLEHSDAGGVATMNFSQVAFGVGAVGGPLLFGAAVALEQWRTGYLVLAAAIAVLFVVFLREPSDDTRPERAAQRGTLFTLLRRPILLALCCGIFLYVWSEIALANWIREYFLDRFALGKAGLGLWATLTISVFWGSITLGRFLVGRYLPHVDDLRLIVWSLVASALTQGALLVVPSPVVATIVVFVHGLAMACVWPTILSLAGSIFIERRATAFGLIVAAGALGGALGASAIGLVAKVVSLHSSLFLCPTALLLNAVLFLVIRSRLAHRQAAGA